MELRQLRQILVLSETLNFRRAAERLHMAQPPLSTSIRKLEEELGVQLFERLPSGVKLTPAGEVVLRYARRTLFFAEQTRRAAREGESGEQGVLRLGFVGSASYSLMPRIIRAFRRRYPQVETFIDESTTVGLLRRVEAHSLDVALVRFPVLEPTEAEVVLLQPDRMMAAVSADSPFAQRESVAIAELAGESFVVFSRTQVPAMHALTMQVFAEAGIQPRVAQEAVQVQHLLGLVDSGLGIAFVPESCRAYVGGSVRLVRLQPMPTAFHLGLALASLPEALTPAACNFIALAHAVVAEDAAPER